MPVKRYTYLPKGTCSSRMDFELEDDRIVSLTVTNGCSGNLQGISRLVQGMKIEDAIQKLEGIRCGYKPTSCPDQIAQALKSFRQLEH
jgi:uncharacterized protein (TIGR03905 family)